MWKMNPESSPKQLRWKTLNPKLETSFFRVDSAQFLGLRVEKTPHAKMTPLPVSILNWEPLCCFLGLRKAQNVHKRQTHSKYPYAIPKPLEKKCPKRRTINPRIVQAIFHDAELPRLQMSSRSIRNNPPTSSISLQSPKSTPNNGPLDHMSYCLNSFRGVI